MALKVSHIHQHIKHGYEVRTELHDNPDPTSQPIEMKSAYTARGDYIGDPATAKTLCEKMGIKPELITHEHNVCSIGFCENDQKWYGWSHRAIYGFGVGSTTKKGDCGYTPSNVGDLVDEYAELYDNIEIVDGRTIAIHESTTPMTDELGGMICVGEATEPEPLLIKTGKGVWTARTLEDAKQMAIDFANGVA